MDTAIKYYFYTVLFRVASFRLFGPVASGGWIQALQITIIK